MLSQIKCYDNKRVELTPTGANLIVPLRGQQTLEKFAQILQLKFTILILPFWSKQDSSVGSVLAWYTDHGKSRIRIPARERIYNDVQQMFYIHLVCLLCVVKQTN